MSTLRRPGDVVQPAGARYNRLEVMIDLGHPRKVLFKPTDGGGIHVVRHQADHECRVEVSAPT